MDCTEDRYSKSIRNVNLLKIALVNPNTSASITSEMVRIAEASLDKRAKVFGFTAQRGAKFISEPKSLFLASRAVEELAPLLSKMDAVVVAAFGDPGLYELRRALPMPVTGIAEASMYEAGKRGRAFAVVTTTPQLREIIAKKASDYGCNNFKGTWTTPGDPTKHLVNPKKLICLLADAINQACREEVIEAVIIGGGPLAAVAKDLKKDSPIPIIEPVPEAIRLSLKRLMEQI